MSVSPSTLRPYQIVAGKIDLQDLRAIYNGEVRLFLDQSAVKAIEVSKITVDQILDSGKMVYGINLGYGKFTKTRISVDQLAKMQRNLLLSHCAGVGELLANNVLRLVIACKVISLARGYSGVRLQLVWVL